MQDKMQETPDPAL